MTARALRDWRRRSDHTIESAARTVGVSPRTWHRWEAAEYPVPRWMDLLAQAYERLPHGR